MTDRRVAVCPDPIPATALHARLRARPRTSRGWLIAWLGLPAWLLSGAAHAVDVNTASAAQLQNVRGIGPKTASVIVQERDSHGRYASFDDLADRVAGIGPKRLQRLRQGGLTLGGSTGASGAGAISARPNVIINTPARGKGKQD